MAKDFLGNELNIGDQVAFMQLSYRSMMRARVTKISDCYVMLQHEKTNLCNTESRQRHNQVIKIG